MDGKRPDKPCPATLDDGATFRFECALCGGCCREDRVIALTPQDVFNLSRHLGLVTGAFLDAYCDVDLEAGLNGVPLAAVRTVDGACVFVRDSLCAVHSARPACCRNFPVGTAFDPDRGPMHELMAPPRGCRGFESGPERSVAAWWEESGMNTLMPGIRLMALAAGAVRRRLSPHHRARLLALLYDFDSPDPAGNDFSALYPRLQKGIEEILANTPPLPRP